MKGTSLLELLAGLLLSLTAAVVGVWQVTRRDRSLHGGIDDRALNLPRLQRWDTDYRPPRMQRLRARFPRVEVSRAALLLCLVIAAVAGGALYYTRSSSRDASEHAAYETALQQIATRRQEAGSSGDLTAAYAMLIDASAELDELVAAHPFATPDTRIDQERQAITAEMARLSGVQRLGSIQTLGLVPDAEANVAPRLVTGGGRVYLLSDAVYQVDAPSSTLVRLLESGQLVDEKPVGNLTTLSWRDDRLLALDATRAYVLDPATGTWYAEPLQTLDAAGYESIAAAETFDANLYLLDRDGGQILKFVAGAYDMPPDNWNGTVATEELRRAVDMAIDGHVYVLLEDGSILDFFRSKLERTIVPQVVPTLDRAAAIVSNVDSSYLYLLHAPDGRILRLDRDGGLVQQFTPAAGAPVMRGATDLAVDERSGIAYVLASDILYLVRLPAGPEQTTPGQATP